VRDTELVRRLKDYDEAAYCEVLARYGDPLYGYIYGLTGDPQLSEDILSSTYLRMVERIDTFTFYGPPFKAWLYRIAHNLAINALRSTRRTVPLSNELPAGPKGDNPETACITSVEQAELRAALPFLTSEQQDVLLLRFVAEHNVREVAEVLGKSETAVKQLQFRALRSLGKILEQRGIGIREPQQQAARCCVDS
jgi:RNA polymerase sigma-70 factor, ECF subfamily